LSNEMRIALICPTRGRPERFVGMVESAMSLASFPEGVYVHLAVDADDSAKSEYERTLPPRCTLHVNREPLSVPGLMDWLAKEVPADILMAASDDILIRTRGWDEKVRAAFAAVPDRILLAYTNDGRDRDKVEHFFVSREWVEATGYFMYPDFEHFCGDEWNEHIGRALGRAVFLRDVVTEHMHCKYGKSVSDETYKMKRRAAADGTSMSQRDVSRMRALMPEVERIATRVRERIAIQAAT
jgi:hypothetical protein